MKRKMMNASTIICLLAMMPGCAEQGASVADTPPGEVKAASPKSAKVKPRGITPGKVAKGRD